MKASILTAMILLTFGSAFTLASISGHVTVMNDGNPVIPRGMVDVLTPPAQGMEPAGRAEIADDGSYTVGGLPVGTYLVRAVGYGCDHYPEFYNDAHDWRDATPVVITQPNQAVGDIDFSLDAVYHEGEASLSGWVRNQLGNGVRDAHVFLYRADYGFQYFIETQTNQNGHFEFEHIPAQSVYLAVRHPDFVEYYYPDGATYWTAEPIEIPEMGHVENISCVLEPVGEGLIHGRVTSQTSGQPLSAARVTALQPCPGEAGNYSTLTDEEGFYSLPVPAGSYIVRAQAEGFKTRFWDNQVGFQNAERLIVDGSVDDIDFALPTRGSYIGSITGAIQIDNGTPEIPCMVIAVSSDEEEGWEESVMMAPGGGYTITDVPDGNYYVYAVTSDTPPVYWPGAYNWEGAQTVAVNGPVTGIDLGLATITDSGLVRVSGQVYAGGRNPLANAAIVVVDSANQPMGCSLSDNDGSFDIPGLQPGVYNLIATKTYYSTVTQVELLGDATELNFTLNHAGTAVDPGQSAPEPAFDVAVYPNPFNPETSIAFTLSRPGRVEATIFNLLGEKVTSLYEGPMESGSHQLVWDGTNDKGTFCAGGIYFCRVRLDESTRVVKMALLK